MLEIAREYPFLVPFILVLVPFAFVILLAAWLLILAKRGEQITLNLKGLGLELAMSTSLSPPSDEHIKHVTNQG